MQDQQQTSVELEITQLRARIAELESAFNEDDTDQHECTSPQYLAYENRRLVKLAKLQQARRQSYIKHIAYLESLLCAIGAGGVGKQAQPPIGTTASMPGASGFTLACFDAAAVPVGTKLYAHPQVQRAPLTDEQIDEIVIKGPAGAPWSHWFARAVEAAHGIK